MATAPERSTRLAETIFSHVLAGIDGSPESLEAARQAAVLAEPGAPLELVTAWELAPPVITGLSSTPNLEPDVRAAHERAETIARDAAAQFPSARTHVTRGLAGDVLLDAARTEQATLIAVGSHGQRRLEGIVFGSTATRVVHDAPCSVLVARSGGTAPPQRIAVGVDGSGSSALAYAAARLLAARFGGEVVVVVAEGDRLVDLPAVSLIVGDDFRVTPEEPVPVLTAAAADADLLVVGSRGLHGVRALGSVSERVAHRAACSTLIVRAEGL